MTEEEKRLHRCCFTGHRPEKLNVPEDEAKAWLEAQIDAAIADGFTTFISGCAMGVDIWAGQIVLRKKDENPELHLIAATPWPGFAARWKDEWKDQYNALLRDADLVVNVSDHYHNGVFQIRNEWMVDHSSPGTAQKRLVPCIGKKHQPRPPKWWPGFSVRKSLIASSARVKPEHSCISIRNLARVLHL